MELGIYTFGDRVPDPRSGTTISALERTRQMLELATIADGAGLDILGVGEHHALRYVNSATATLIAAMAAVTKRIRFTSASTSISTADPVRTFQEFATADLVSNGRVELIFGRGAFVDNFPLFGFEMSDYDALFVEKVALFEKLNASERVTWKGRFRPALRDAEISPRPAQVRLPVWIGAGSPETVVRAAMLGYPLAIPMVGGSLPGYARLAALYHDAWRRRGDPRAPAKLATFAHLHVSDDSLDDFFPYYSAYLEPLFKGPMPRSAFEQMSSPAGALVAGSPQQVVDKLLAQHEAMGTTRFLGQLDIGAQPFDVIVKSLELFATKVAPVVRRHTTSPPDAS
jgi:alkanesulfonate monooxygenase SsuD/methylene tetrahydromethanopterin reductase-like flavin-dependent oxidoreductase (luciferase family)